MHRRFSPSQPLCDVINLSTNVQKHIPALLHLVTGSGHFFICAGKQRQETIVQPADARRRSAVLAGKRVRLGGLPPGAGRTTRTMAGRIGCHGLSPTATNFGKNPRRGGVQVGETVPRQGYHPPIVTIS